MAQEKLSFFIDKNGDPNLCPSLNDQVRMSGTEPSASGGRTKRMRRHGGHVGSDGSGSLKTVNGAKKYPKQIHLNNYIKARRGVVETVDLEEKDAIIKKLSWVKHRMENKARTGDLIKVIYKDDLNQELFAINGNKSGFQEIIIDI